MCSEMDFALRDIGHMKLLYLLRSLRQRRHQNDDVGSSLGLFSTTENKIRNVLYVNEVYLFFNIVRYLMFWMGFLLQHEYNYKLNLKMGWKYNSLRLMRSHYSTKT